jgi:hypothetical protein
LPNQFAKSKCQIDLANHLGKSRSGKMVWQTVLANLGRPAKWFEMPNRIAESKCLIKMPDR